MSAASRVNVALGWMADRFVIGAFTFVLSLGVVTAPAAFAAGAAAHRSPSLHASILELFGRFRSHLRRGLGAGSVMSVFAASAAVATLWVGSTANATEQVIASAIGLQAALASVATLVFSAAALDMGLTPSPRTVAVLIGACPGVFLSSAALIFLGIALGTFVAPILLLPVTGFATGIIGGVRVSYERRVSRFTATAG